MTEILTTIDFNVFTDAVGMVAVLIFCLGGVIGTGIGITIANRDKRGK